MTLNEKTLIEIDAARGGGSIELTQVFDGYLVVGVFGDQYEAVSLSLGEAKRLRETLDAWIRGSENDTR
jgi:hypothetical protein